MPEQGPYPEPGARSPEPRQQLRKTRTPCPRGTRRGPSTTRKTSRSVRPRRLVAPRYVISARNWPGSREACRPPGGGASAGRGRGPGKRGGARRAQLAGVRGPGRRLAPAPSPRLRLQVRALGRKGRAEGGLWPRPGSAPSRSGGRARPGTGAAAGPGSGERAPGAIRGAPGRPARLPTAGPQREPGGEARRPLLGWRSSSVPRRATSGLPAWEEPGQQCQLRSHRPHGRCGNNGRPRVPSPALACSCSNSSSPSSRNGVGSGPEPSCSDSKPPAVLEGQGGWPLASSPF